VTDAVSMLHDVHRRHIPFAAIYAATLTAREVKTHEQSVMRRVFDRPTPYTLNALATKPATKAAPVASVEFKEFGGTPAKRFLNPEIHGGARSMKSFERQMGGQFYAPGKGAVLNAYGNIAGSVYRRMLSQLMASTNADANASGSRRSKKKRKSDAYFVTKRGGIMQRKGSDVKLVLVPIRAPNYRKLFPFYDEAKQVVAARYPDNFVTALNRAIATSHFKTERGKTWRDSGYIPNW
jgi:hypothetical protein